MNKVYFYYLMSFHNFSEEMMYCYYRSFFFETIFQAHFIVYNKNIDVIFATE